MPSTNMRKACSDASSVSERTHPLLRRRTCLSHVSCSRFFQKHVPDERRLSQTRQTRQGSVEFFLDTATWLFSNESVVAPQLHATGARRPACCAQIRRPSRQHAKHEYAQSVFGRLFGVGANPSAPAQTHLPLARLLLAVLSKARA